jgi:hypothetical protein
MFVCQIIQRRACPPRPGSSESLLVKDASKRERFLERAASFSFESGYLSYMAFSSLFFLSSSS